MHKSILLFPALLLVGCGSGASYKNPEGRDLVVSLDKVDIQDFATTGQAMLQSMLTSPVFDRPGAKPVLAIGRLTNDTGSNFDTDLLLSKLNVPLVNSGRVVLLAKDPVAEEAQAKVGGVSPKPDFVLSGKILEDRAAAGKTRQASFVFQLTLIDVRRGVAAWTDEKIVTKQGTKNAVGF